MRLKERTKELIRAVPLIDRRFSFITDFYQSGFSRRVLLSYIIHPFRRFGASSKHANIRQARAIAESFHQRGYSVDIINYDRNYNSDICKYDILFGFGDTYEKSFFKEYNGKRIYYATGAHTCQRHNAELLRLERLKRRRGVLLYPKRFKSYPDAASSVLSDAIICTGNMWTTNTYRTYFNGPIFEIPVSVDDKVLSFNIRREFSETHKSFLWIGGYGMILKGLDICVEAFLRNPQLQLLIIGRRESDFFGCYGSIIEEAQNISYLGYMDVHSEEFLRASRQCAYLIYPSASEGMSGSVLTGMAMGLVPIITKETGVYTPHGIMLKDDSVESISEAVRRAAHMPESVWKSNSSKLVQSSRSRYTLERYGNSLNEALDVIL